MDSDSLNTILAQVDAVVRGSEEQTRALEMEPARSELFELFAQAHRAGFVSFDGEAPLSADELCRELGARWGLKSAAESSLRDQAALPAEQLARMRSLWSLLRMWMEWTYAWERWPQFHVVPSTEPPASRFSPGGGG